MRLHNQNWAPPKKIWRCCWIWRWSELKCGCIWALYTTTASVSLSKKPCPSSSSWWWWWAREALCTHCALRTITQRYHPPHLTSPNLWPTWWKVRKYNRVKCNILPSQGQAYSWIRESVFLEENLSKLASSIDQTLQWACFVLQSNVGQSLHI